MTTLIEKDFSLHTAVHFDDKFYINLYDFVLSMHVQTDSIKEQNIAMDRITYFLLDVLQDSILINTEQDLAVSKYADAGLRICELHEDPYDQIVAMAIISKLNAIAGGRLHVTKIALSSTLGSSVKFVITDEMAKSHMNGQHWWNQSDTCLSHIETKCNDENVVELFTGTCWSELGLSWK